MQLNSPQDGGSSVPSLQSWMESHTHEFGIHFPSSQRNWSEEHVRPPEGFRYRFIEDFAHSTQQMKHKLSMSLFLTLCHSAEGQKL